MQGTGRGSEHRRHSVLPPHPNPPPQIWKQTGTELGVGGGRLVSVHMLHLETQMPKNDEFLHQCMFLLQRVCRIDRNHKYKRREIWLRRREAKFIVLPNPQVRSEDTDQIRRWLSENLTAPMPFFTAAHNCYSRKKGCFSRANLWHFIPFS